MKIGPTPAVQGDSLGIREIVEDVALSLSVEPPHYAYATSTETTVSISGLYIGNPWADLPPGETPGGSPIDPYDDYVYYGMASRHFGLGGAPPYIDGYPVGGYDFRSITGPGPLSNKYIYNGVPTLFLGFGFYPIGGMDVGAIEDTLVRNMKHDLEVYNHGNH